MNVSCIYDAQFSNACGALHAAFNHSSWVSGCFLRISRQVVQCFRCVVCCFQSRRLSPRLFLMYLTPGLPMLLLRCMLLSFTFLSSGLFLAYRRPGSQCLCCVACCFHSLFLSTRLFLAYRRPGFRCVCSVACCFHSFS